MGVGVVISLGSGSGTSGEWDTQGEPGEGS
jgi:hypothetical protein